MKNFLMLLISVCMLYYAYDQINQNLKAQVFNDEEIASVQLCENYSGMRNVRVPYDEKNHITQNIKLNVTKDNKAHICRISIVREAKSGVPQDSSVSMFATTYMQCVLDEFGQVNLGKQMDAMRVSKIQDSYQLVPQSYSHQCHFFILKNNKWAEYKR